FPIYEYLKQSHTLRQGRPIKSWEAAVCGSLAGGTAAALTTPLDVVKTRVMLSTKGMGAHLEYSGIVPTLTRIAREEGVRALFSGIVPRTIWISVGGFVFLGSYEKVKAMLIEAGIFAHK
ncbi:S-adenosylmethionine transporter, partial [Coemansia sp. RSA 2531]